MRQDPLYPIAFWAEVQTGLPICGIFYIIFILLTYMFYRAVDNMLKES